MAAKHTPPAYIGDHGALTAYHPTLRDRAAMALIGGAEPNTTWSNFVGRLIGSQGAGNTGEFSLGDLMPWFQADEAGRQMASGHPIVGAANLAMALPLPVGKVAEAAARAVAHGVGRKAAEVVAEDAGKAAAPIIAYHGSPHAFDKFDTAKIGTGEGAQAYGHGLYFAENEDTAKSYRDALTTPVAPTYAAPGGFLKRPQQLETRDLSNVSRQVLAESKYDLAAALPRLALYRHNPEIAADLAKLQAMHDAGAEVVGGVNPGSMYQVGIKAHPDHFLDWDAPLSRDYVEQKLGNFPEVLQADAARRSFLGPEKGFTGRDVYAKLAAWNPGGALSPAAGAGAEASAKLAQAGIPGIKYLDAGSRTAGDGTRNYVVFDPRHIDILKRYGIPATVMGALGGSALIGQDDPAPAF